MMAAPWVHPKTGMLWYRKVIPPRARHLFGGKWEVRRSLKTRDPREAKARHAQIAAEIEARIATFGAPPQRLTYQEQCMLAGEWYRRKRDEWEPDPGDAEGWAAVWLNFRDDLDKHRMQAKRVG